MILISGRKVKKKDFGFEIPKEVEESIDLFVDGHNNDDLMTDCYADDLYSMLNGYSPYPLSDEQADELRDYYLRGGMYEKN